MINKLFDRLPTWAVAIILFSLPVVAIVAPAVLTSGCTTINGTNQLDVARVASIAGAAAQMGSAAYLSKNPEARPYFVASFNALGALDHAGEYDPAAFAEALKMLPIKEMSGPNGSLYVLGAILIWDELAQRSVNVDKTLWVQPVLRAVRIGIGRAIGVTPGTKARGYIP